MSRNQRQALHVGVVQAPSNLDLRISLRKAAQRERDVMLIRPRTSLVALTDIGWNRNGSPSQLRCKAVQLFSGKELAHAINAYDKLDPELPGFKIALTESYWIVFESCTHGLN